MISGIQYQIINNGRNNSPGLWPMRRVGSPLAFLVSCSFFLQCGDPPASATQARWTTIATFSAFGRSTDRFLSIFVRPGATSKNIDFSTSTKIAQSGGAIDPGAPRDRFWTQKHDFWGPFLAPFFDFFEKPKNHEIDDPYNVLDGFSPSEISHFPMDFPSFFMFFPEPLPEGVFRGSRCRYFLESAVLVPFRIFAGARNPPSDAPFSPERPKTTPGTPRAPFLSIFHRFWTHFQDFSMNFVQKNQPRPNNTTNHFLKILARRNARKRLNNGFADNKNGFDINGNQNHYKNNGI